jgi:hypothetical protein
MSTTEAKKVHLTDYTSKHGGPTVPIYVTTEGRFVATIGEVELDHPHFDSVKRQIDDTVYGHRIDVPFVDRNGRRGTLRGFHASQRKVLVTWENGNKDSLDSYSEVFRPENISDEQIDAIRAAIRQITEAHAQLETLREGTERVNELLAEKIGDDLFEYNRDRKVGA